MAGDQTSRTSGAESDHRCAFAKLVFLGCTAVCVPPVDQTSSARQPLPPPAGGADRWSPERHPCHPCAADVFVSTVGHRHPVHTDRVCQRRIAGIAGIGPRRVRAPLGLGSAGRRPARRRASPAVDAPSRTAAHAGVGRQWTAAPAQPVEVPPVGRGSCHSLQRVWCGCDELHRGACRSPPSSASRPPSAARRCEPDCGRRCRASTPDVRNSGRTAVWCGGYPHPSDASRVRGGGYRYRTDRSMPHERRTTHSTAALVVIPRPGAARGPRSARPGHVRRDPDTARDGALQRRDALVVTHRQWGRGCRRHRPWLARATDQRWQRRCLYGFQVAAMPHASECAPTTTHAVLVGNERLFLP